VKVWPGAASKYEMLPSSAIEPSLAGPPESMLVGRCVSGDERAWRELHRVYYPVAGAFLRKLGVRERELEDATQEVFVQLYRSLPEFRGEAQLKTWLYRLCATQARRSRRFQVVTDAVAQWLGLSAPTATLQELGEDLARERVSRALDQLSDGDRLVLVLFELEGLSGAEVAKVVGCPVATVWRRLHYGRRRFREALGVSEDESS
jgi:RNA polymerase sigma-70 factor, ECF subfamily